MVNKKFSYKSIYECCISCGKYYIPKGRINPKKSYCNDCMKKINLKND